MTRWKLAFLLIVVWSVLFGRDWLEWTLNYNAVDPASTMKPKAKSLRNDYQSAFNITTSGTTATLHWKEY